MTRITVLVLSALLSVSCAGRRSIEVLPAADYTIKANGGYGYVKQPDGSYLVYVISDKYLPEARRDIVCPCTEEMIGRVYKLKPATH